MSSVFTHMDLEGDNIVFARVGFVKISFQPCGHEEAVDSSLEIFNLQSFILALALPGDGHCEELQAKHIECPPFTRSAVSVEGDRAVFLRLCRS